MKFSSNSLFYFKSESPFNLLNRTKVPKTIKIPAYSSRFLFLYLNSSSKCIKPNPIMKVKLKLIIQYHQEPNILICDQYSSKAKPKNIPSDFIVNELLTIKTKASISSSEILIYVLLWSLYYCILMTALTSFEAANLDRRWLFSLDSNLL